MIWTLYSRPCWAWNIVFGENVDLLLQVLHKMLAREELYVGGCDVEWIYVYILYRTKSEAHTARELYQASGRTRGLCGLKPGNSRAVCATVFVWYNVT